MLLAAVRRGNKRRMLMLKQMADSLKPCEQEICEPDQQPKVSESETPEPKPLLEGAGR